MAGIYIHIPFCRQACTYCNFHFSTSLARKSAVINAIINEIHLCDRFNESAEEIQTIYFGGGTPSILSENELSSIIASLHKKFKIAGDAEITLEANPDNIERATLQQWKQLGINRLSVGIQSFQDEELKWMNRSHNADESLRCLDEISGAGITNFSVDLIYGSPLLSNDDFKKNVDLIFSKNVPHISCYALTVEPKTALDAMIRQHKSPAVNSDRQSDQFLLLMQWMRAAGYEHYEISNFAKPGMRSRHNSSYWQGKPYYGFGPSAHSFTGTNIRRWNIANNTLYIQSLEKQLIPYTEEILTDTQRLNEYIMIALRTAEGIDIEKIKRQFGEKFKEDILNHCKKYESAQMITLKNDRLLLTDQGKLLADGISADLFFSDVVSLK